MGLRLEGFAPLLQVFDMPTSVAFYRDVLGFELVESSEAREQDDFDWALLRRGRLDLMLNTMYEVDRRPERRDPARIAAHEDVSLYFGCRDLDGAYAHIRAKGVVAQPPTVAPYGMRQLYFHDPDGYLICLQWPAKRS